MSRIDLDIDILRGLVTAMGEGGFARAAARLGRSPSALSLQMRKLEGQLGQQLLRRQGRGVVLTEAGETALRYARRLVALNDEMVAALGRPALTGAARIGILPDYAETVLPPVLARFVQSHPAVQVEAVVERSAVLRRLLAADGLDMALLHAAPDGAAPLDATEAATATATLLRRLAVGWVAAPGYRPDPDQPVPLALLNPPCPFRDLALTALERAGRPWRVVFTSGSPAGLWAAAAAGLGVTPRPLAAAPAGLATAPAGLTNVGPAWGLPPLPDIGLWMLTRRAAAGNPAAALLGELAATALGGAG